jgi:phosphoribosylamine--glycine ligase
MKVLVVGKGGREHALAWKIAQSKAVEKVYAFPGNPGIAEVADIPNLPDDKNETLKEFVKNNGIDLTVVGPEAYLANGIADVFEKEGLKIFGVNRKAAQLESSKAFAKEIMQDAGIPTASHSTVDNLEDGRKIFEACDYPIVLKADGLAAGKGVVICSTENEAQNELKDMLGGKFSEAGSRIVIEQFLKGEELSLLLFVDGENVRPLQFSQDHKALLDGDKGPNTGGMGAYTPVSIADKKTFDDVDRLVVKPLLAEFRKKGIDYRGILYIGLMMVDKTPYVLEYNVRFGDPETEPLMMMMKSDIIPYMTATCERKLGETDEIKWHEGAGATVVLASNGYPGSYKKGIVIENLDKTDEDCVVFHAGTKSVDNSIVTDGGRVLMVTCRGENISQALEKTYKNVDKVHFDGAYCRKDIGHREVGRK